MLFLSRWLQSWSGPRSKDRPTWVLPAQRPPFHPRPPRPEITALSPLGACKSQAWASGALGPNQRASSPRICVHGLTCSVTQTCLTLWHPMDYSTPSLSFPISQSLLQSLLMSIESVMPSNHVILCRPLLLLPSIFPSIRVFSNESALHIRWPKYCSFNFSISPSSEHSGLISFRIAWFDLLSVQGTLESLLQHHDRKNQSSALSLLDGPTLTSVR